MRAPWLVLTLALTLLAGCVSPPTDEGAAGDAPANESAVPAAAVTDQGTPSSPPQTGALVVLAMMPDRSPLPGVSVEAGNATGLTDAEGRVRFDGLPPGFVNVTARKEAHRTAQLGAEVAAGGTTTVEAILPAVDGSSHSHEHGVFAHRDLYRFHGHFDCSATYLIVTGDCFLLVDNVTNQTGAPAYLGSATSENHLIQFPLDLNWTALVVEMTWEPPNAAMGQGMTLALEPAEAPADGHAAKYARVVGGSPLRVELVPGVKHETATLNDMPNPNGGEVLRARAFVMGEGHNPGGTTFLGVGASVQHEFDLYVSIFYGDAPPEGYSAVGQV